MKKYILLLLLAFTTNSYCQDLKDDQTVYKLNEVDEKPEFEGGMQKLYTYVTTNFMVPEKSGLKGKTVIEFIVEKDGTLSDMKVTQDIGYGTREEILRMFKKFKKWKPGKKNAEIVRTLFVFPVNINNP